VCTSIGWDLDVILAIETLRDVAKILRGLEAGAAEDAFLAGWVAGGGADAEMDRAPERGALVLDVASRTVSRGVGRRRAASLLGAWEGYGRFTRECCGFELDVLAKGVAAVGRRSDAGGEEALSEGRAGPTFPEARDPAAPGRP
jgi:hypothetical protein